MIMLWQHRACRAPG